MSMLRDVTVSPPTGFRDRPWGDYDPSLDAFTRSARRVSEAYAAALRESRVESTGPSTVSIGPELDDGKPYSVRVDPDRLPLLSGPHEAWVFAIDYRFGGFDSARCLLPTGLELTAPQARARLALDVIGGAMDDFASLRGWDRAPLLAAHEAVIDSDYQFTWKGRWKASPSRKHRVRPAFWLGDDGYGRSWLEIETRGGDLVGVSPLSDAFSTVEGFKRAADTVSWIASDAVAYLPDVGLFGMAGPPALWSFVDLVDAVELPVLDDGPPARWDVRVQKY